MKEIKQLLMPASEQRLQDLASEAAAEQAAGILPEPGTKQALYRAACWHRLQLTDEYCALLDFLNGDLWFPKMPKRTAPWEEVEAALSVPQPSTPEGSGAPVRSRRGGSSDEAAVPAGDTHLDEAAHLLPSEAGPSAPGLRWRQGHENARPWAPH